MRARARAKYDKISVPYKLATTRGGILVILNEKILSPEVFPKTNIDDGDTVILGVLAGGG